MRILIADDSQPIRKGVAGILSQDARLEVCGEASDGTEALQKSRELRPDLVLLDISMPGISGFETARLLRQQIPEIRIVIMSFGAPLQLSPCALEAGADECVDKSQIAKDLPRIINGFWPRILGHESPNAAGMVPDRSGEPIAGGGKSEKSDRRDRLSAD